MHLTPRDWDFQRLAHFQLDISPDPASLKSHDDWFGNPATWLALRQPHDRLRLIAASTVDVLPRPAAWRARRPAPPGKPSLPGLPPSPAAALPDAQECALPTAQTPALDDIRRWALTSFTPGRPRCSTPRAT